MIVTLFLLINDFIFYIYIIINLFYKSAFVYSLGKIGDRMKIKMKIAAATIAATSAVAGAFYSVSNDGEQKIDAKTAVEILCMPNSVNLVTGTSSFCKDAYRLKAFTEQISNACHKRMLVANNFDSFTNIFNECKRDIGMLYNNRLDKAYQEYFPEGLVVKPGGRMSNGKLKL